MFFNSKKRAQAKKEYLEHIHETCKTTSVAEILAEENKALREENTSIRKDSDTVYELYEEECKKSTALSTDLAIARCKIKELESELRTIRGICDEGLVDTTCKEVDSTDFTIDDAINFANSLEDGSCDDDDDYDDFWDCDDPEEVIHDELFERNDDEEEDDDEDECCECPREKAINNVIGCIVDLLTGTPVDEVIDELDTDTIFGVLFG